MSSMQKALSGLTADRCGAWQKTISEQANTLDYVECCQRAHYTAGSLRVCQPALRMHLLARLCEQAASAAQVLVTMPDHSCAGL